MGVRGRRSRRFSFCSVKVCKENPIVNSEFGRESQRQLSAEDGYGKAVKSSRWTRWPAEVCPWCQPATQASSRCWQKSMEVSLACPRIREPSASCSTACRRTSLIWGLPLAVGFSVLWLSGVFGSLVFADEKHLSVWPGFVWAPWRCSSCAAQHVLEGSTVGAGSDQLTAALPAQPSAQRGAKQSRSAGVGSGPSSRAKSTSFVLLALSWHPAERTTSAFWCSVSNKLASLFCFWKAAASVGFQFNSVAYSFSLSKTSSVAGEGKIKIKYKNTLGECHTGVSIRSL